MPDLIKDMPDLIKKTMLAGVGLALKTWDEVEDLTKELVEKGKMGEKEGSKFLKDLQNRYDDTQKKLEARVEKTVKEFLKRGVLLSPEELEKITETGEHEQNPDKKETDREVKEKTQVKRPLTISSSAAIRLIQYR